MPSGPKSGKFATVRKNGQADVCPTVGNWSINYTAQSETIYASNTYFGPVRQPSILDWQGSFTQYLGVPCVMPGEKFLFEGYTAPQTGVYGNDGEIYKGNAVCDSIIMTMSWQPTMSLTTVVNFSADGCLSTESGFFQDESCLLPAQMCNLRIDYSKVANPSEDDIWLPYQNVRQAIFTLGFANLPYSNSSTNCCMKREAGNIDWNLAIVEEETEDVFNTNEDNHIGFRLYIDYLNTGTADDLFWELKWGTLDGYSGLVADRDTGEIIRKTAAWLMTGLWRWYDDPAWDCTSGLIRYPNYADPPNPIVFWPVLAVPSP